MSVAPSFQSFKFLTEPYLVSGKWYIQVQNPKTGTERQVRWYPEKGSAAAPVKESGTKILRSQKDVLGFEKGPITIFTGNTYEDRTYFKQSHARYTRWWGWYFQSTDSIPNDLPEDVTPIHLPWELVGNEDGNLKSEDEVIRAVESLIYEPGTSEFVGEIGERLDLRLKVTRAINLENNFGHSTMHIMEDDIGNVYVWTTASKSWAEGTEKSLRGTVKDHRIYKNTHQTILTRCKEL